MKLFTCNKSILDLCVELLDESTDFGFVPFDGVRREYDDQVILSESQVRQLFKDKPPRGKTRVDKMTKLAAKIEKMVCDALHKKRVGMSDIELDTL